MELCFMVESSQQLLQLCNLRWCCSLDFMLWLICLINNVHMNNIQYNLLLTLRFKKHPTFCSFCAFFHAFVQGYSLKCWLMLSHGQWSRIKRHLTPEINSTVYINWLMLDKSKRKYVSVLWQWNQFNPRVTFKAVKGKWPTHELDKARSQSERGLWGPWVKNQRACSQR